MALTYSNPGELGSEAAEFSLPGVDGKTYRLKDFRDAKALVVVFMCNHCPYVKAVRERINVLAKDYGRKNVSLIGINSNDAKKYPDDSFESMKQASKDFGYAFPYLFDETQEVAKAYGAVCTPDFYVYEPTDSKFLLRYRGRLDDNWKDEKSVSRHELADALDEILAGRRPIADQLPSMGCSIKWK